MNKANIIVMGKTGVGKSTLINAILGEKRAKTGIGQAQTQKNETYSTTVQLGALSLVSLNLMDTIGLELNSKTNTRTIEYVRDRIDTLSQKYMDDKADIKEVDMVWYCVNPNSSRFEDFEEDFIKEMMYKYEIPFMIVFTQCFDENQAEAMKNVIHTAFPKMPIESVLAEKKSMVDAYGVKELLNKTVTRFNEYKLDVLQDKLEQVDYELEKELREKADFINRSEQKARKIIKDRAKAARQMGWVPLVSAAALPTQYTATVNEIASVFGIKLSEDAVIDIIACWTTNLVLLPIFLIPGVASKQAGDLIEDKGQEFLDSIVAVVKSSSRFELANSKLISERLKNEIKRRKNK